MAAYKVLRLFLFLSQQRANKGSKVMERLKKKLSEQESQLLLNSPNMPLRVQNRNGKVRASDSQPFCRIWFSFSNSFSMFLLMLTVRVDYAFQSYIFLISSDYERAEWKEVIREQQKKCEWHCHWNQDVNRWYFYFIFFSQLNAYLFSRL